MTLDELALMIQGEFMSVHEKLKEHDNEFSRIREDIKILRNDMEAGFNSFALILKSIQEDIQDFKRVKIEVAELRNRVERLEAKLGIAG